MNFKIKYKQLGTQDDSYASAQLPTLVASSPINFRPNIPAAFAKRKCVIPLTFSQQMYQFHKRKFN